MLGSIAMSLSEMFPEQILALKGLITLFMVLPIPLIIVFIFSAFLFIEEDIPMVEDIPKEIPYEEKYPLSKIDKNSESKNEKTDTDKKDDPEKWKDKMKLYLNEYTPNGNVIIRYNYKTEAFDFWCDDKNIKYPYLETVARKYVSVFDCRELYIDRSENIEKQMENIKRKKIEKEQKEQQQKEQEEKSQENKVVEREDNDDDLFVKLKTPLEKNKEKHKSKMELRNRRMGIKSTDEEITKKSLAPTKANKYIRKGDLKEADLYEKKEKVVHKNISFGMFKSMFGSSGSTSPMT